MKTLVIITVYLLSLAAAAQTKVDKVLPVQKGQKVKIEFDYPGVTVSTWDKNEIAIQGTVSLNNGESDEAFQLLSSTTGNTVSIRGQIKDIESLPHRIVVKKDGEKLTFRNENEWQKYKEERGGGHQYSSHGVDIDIKLQIKIPHNMETLVECTYGMIEVKDFTGPLTAKSTYGGVDAFLNESATGELNAETNYGRIYTNLNLKFNKENIRDEDFHTFVSVKPGNGPRYSFSSPYGNVYLRKNN